MVCILGRTSDNGFKKARKRAGLTQPEFCDKFNEFEKNTIKDDFQRSSVTLDTCRNWEQGRKLPRAGTLIELSKFYGVSTDFLLGLSECTSVENEDIRKRIGLNDESIQALEMAVKESDLERKMQDTYSNNSKEILSVVDTINVMLKHSMLVNVANAFRNFLETKYCVPVQYDSSLNKFIYSDSDFSKLNNENLDDLLKQHDINISFPQEYIMHLASSPNKPEDHISFGLSNAFLESVALKQIEQWFYTIKQLYKEEHDDQ